MHACTYIQHSDQLRSMTPLLIPPCWPALYSSSALTSTRPWSCRSPWDSRGEGAGSNRHLHPVSPSTVCVQMWRTENISPCNRGHPGSQALTQGSPKSWLGTSTNVFQHTDIYTYAHIPAVPVNDLVVAGCMHMDTWQLDHENMICILWHCMHNHDNVNIIKMTITVHKLAEHYMCVAAYSVYDFPPHASTSSTEMSSNGLCPSDHISYITIP